jgi:hypothetical protein
MQAGVAVPGRVATGQGIRGHIGGRVIVSPSIASTGVPTLAFYQTFLAVNATHIYWWTRQATGFLKGQVGRAKIDGSDIHSTLIVNAKSEPINLNSFTTAFVIDNAYIYMPDIAVPTPASSLYRAKLDGTEVAFNWLKYAAAEAKVISLDGEYIYFIPNDGTGNKPIVRVKRDGTGLNLAFFLDTEQIKGMVANGNFIYATSVPPIRNRGIDLIDLVEETRTPLVISAGEETVTGAIVADATHIYWLAASIFGGEDKIARAKLDGTEADWNWITPLTGRLLSGGAVLNGLAVDGNYLYWVEKAEGFSFIARRSFSTGLIEREWISGAAKEGAPLKAPSSIGASAYGRGVVRPRSVR